MTEYLASRSHLEAHSELALAKARYCRLLDTKDWAALADLLAEDVTVDLDGGNPTSIPLCGRDTVVEAVRAAVAEAITVHQVHAPECEVTGDSAHVIWAVQERVVWKNGTSLTAYGHYHDRWVRRDGRWLILEMKLIHLLMEFD